MTNKSIISVDIQPDHISFDSDKLKRLADLYNEADEVIFIYNGTRMGYSDLNTIKSWLSEIGVKSEKLINFNFIEKEYGFFRDLTDIGISEELLISLLKYMLDNGYRNINEISPDVIENILGEDITGTEFYIPELYYDLEDLGILPESTGEYTLIGGASDACLKEVEILLRAGNVEYIKNYHFIY